MATERSSALGIVPSREMQRGPAPRGAAAGEGSSAVMPAPFRRPMVSQGSRISGTSAVPGASGSKSGASQGPALPGPGARIGPYEIIRELGRGGMGAVYLARDTKLGRRVAIKFVQSEQPEVTARFIIEARATARCSHENIVVIHEVSEHQGNPFMVLEYLQGTPLGKLVARGQRLPPRRAIELMVPVVRALACAHEHHIVHRDLKPDNILVTDAGMVKVLDFGIAKLAQENEPGREPRARDQPWMPDDSGRTGRDDQAALTRHGALVGTLPFMSPEQWGVGEVDHRTDIWAVGIILYIMVAGKHPLAPLTGRQLMVTSLLQKPMPSVRGACPNLPDELADIIDRCLRKHKDQRMGSARELLDALEPLLPGRQARSLHVYESPYAGLSAFQEADAGRFFGRSREIAAAVARLRDRPLLGVVGPSGAGKSSFVRAGLVPALKQSGEPWTSLVIRPGRQPMEALAQVLAPMVTRIDTGTTDDSTEHDAVCERLRSEPGYLGTALRQRARQTGQRLLLFVDQFEELYTLVPDARERLAFTACLASAADDAAAPVRVVLSIRSDFLDRAAEDASFMAELAHSLFFLNAPGREGLRQALVEPAEMHGHRFEAEAMIEHMLDHLAQTSGALPLLQFAASRLWDMRDHERRLLTEDSYRALGGIAGALASHADAVVAELPSHGQALARALLLRLVTPERTRAVAPMDELCELSQNPAEVQRLVGHLVQSRLLVVQSGGEPAAPGNASAAASGNDAPVEPGNASVEIVHESLIHSWPRLRRWLDENQDDAAFLEQLRSAARQWQARGRPAGLLWRGEAMDEACRWHQRYRGALPEVQRAYLDAVFALATRTGRRKRLLVTGIIGVLSIMVAAAAVALVIITEARGEATAQAEAARNTATRLRKQLQATQTAQRKREQAENEVRVAQRELEQANARLLHKNTELIHALARANKAQRRARRARRMAESNASEAKRAEAEARAAEAEARLTMEEFQRLLVRERGRMRDLVHGVPSMIEDVPVAPGQSSGKASGQTSGQTSGLAPAGQDGPDLDGDQDVENTGGEPNE